MIEEKTSNAALLLADRVAGGAVEHPPTQEDQDRAEEYEQVVRIAINPNNKFNNSKILENCLERFGAAYYLREVIARTLHGKNKIKVMAFGTFDLLHPGHVEFLRRARALGDELIVSVSRDENAKKFKGAPPVFSEHDRQKLVGALRFVKTAVLGSTGNYLAHILKQHPDVIALGYDQKAYVKELKRDIKKFKLSTKIVRLPAYNPAFYKSSRFKSAIRKINRPLAK